MSKRVVAGAMCAAALAFAGQASAATIYNVTLTGTLTSQGAGPDDPRLHVGDTVTLTAHLSSDYVVDWGATGYQVAGSVLHTGPGYGAVGDWQVAASGYSWGPKDDELDNQSPFFTYDGASNDFALSGPYLVIKDGKVVGVGNNSPFYPSVGVAPQLNLGGGPIDGSVGASTSFSGLSFSPNFSISEADNYANFLYTPGFSGTWDFADSSVTLASVPEPDAWALLLLGFFGLGAALRAQRRTRPALLTKA